MSLFLNFFSNEIAIQTHIYLQNLVSIQPRTRALKILADKPTPWGGSLWHRTSTRCRERVDRGHAAAGSAARRLGGNAPLRSFSVLAWPPSSLLGYNNTILVITSIFVLALGDSKLSMSLCFNCCRESETTATVTNRCFFCTRALIRHFGSRLRN